MSSHQIQEDVTRGQLIVFWGIQRNAHGQGVGVLYDPRLGGVKNNENVRLSFVNNDLDFIPGSVRSTAPQETFLRASTSL